jgi:hypothetical protein
MKGLTTSRREEPESEPEKSPNKGLECNCHPRHGSCVRTSRATGASPLSPDVRMIEEMKRNQIAIKTLIGCDIAIAFTIVMTGMECSSLRNAISDLAPIYALILMFVLPIGLVVVERTRAPLDCFSRGQKMFVLGSVIASMAFWLLISMVFVSIAVFIINNNAHPMWLD